LRSNFLGESNFGHTRGKYLLILIRYGLFILFSPVELFRKNLIWVLLAGLARGDIRGIGEGISEKSLHIG
jgi:hypothetical protein